MKEFSNKSTQPFILKWWIDRVPAVKWAGVRAGDAASAGWQVTPYGMQAPVAVLLAQTALTLPLPFLYL